MTLNLSQLHKSNPELYATVVQSQQPKGGRPKGRSRPPKNRLIKARVTDYEFAKIEDYAISKGWTISQVIRDYIRRLRVIKKVEEQED